MTGELPPKDTPEPQDGALDADDDSLEPVGDADQAEGFGEEDLEPNEPSKPGKPQPAPAVGGPGSSKRRDAAARQATGSETKPRVAGGEEETPYIDDRVSKYWVAAIVAIFILILAYGLLFGRAGFFSPPPPTEPPLPTDTPTVSLSPAPTVSPALSPSVVPTITITPAPSASPSGAPSASPSAAPSASPSKAPSVAPSAPASVAPSPS
jgi:hypothetical protein